MTIFFQGGRELPFVKCCPNSFTASETSAPATAGNSMRAYVPNQPELLKQAQSRHYTFYKLATAYAKKAVKSSQKQGRSLSNNPNVLKLGSVMLMIALCFQLTCYAQDFRDRETKVYSFDRFQNKTFEIPVTYTYYYNQRNYEHTLKVDPKADLVRFPLISYSLDFAASPKIALGEEIPGFVLKTPFRYVDGEGKIGEATLEKFSDNKLLIVDFWATWCSPCVASMNKWNEIAAAVEGVEVLGVMLDYDYKAQYYGVDKGWSSPIVFGPQAYILSSFFFDRPVVSRMAWIKDGKLIAFTGTKDYDLQMVKDLLAGKDVQIPMSLDYTYTEKQG